MTKAQRLKMIRRIGNKINRERQAAAKLAHENSVYMSDIEVYNTIQSSGVLDTYSAMKEFDTCQ